MFEAHVAAVYYDYLTSEVPGAFKSAPPSSLPPVDKRTRGGAIDYVFTWLAPLFTPLVQPTLEWMYAKKGNPDSTMIDILAAYVDGVSVLQMWSQQKRSGNSAPVYGFVGQVGPPHCPMFTMSCTVNTPSGQFTATETRPTKKLAKNAAAYQVAVLMDDAGVRGMRSIPREL